MRRWFVGVLIGGCLGCGSTPADDAGTPPLDGGPPGVDAGPGDDAGGLDGGSTDAGTPSDLERRDEAFDTGASGEIAVTVPVSGQRSFMVVASSDTNARLSVLAIEDPTGATVLRWEDWYDGPRNLTNAIFARRTATAVNWPVRDVDPPLMNGDYVVRIGSYRVDGVTSRPNVAVATSTLIARDADLTRGVVRVAIVWADGLAADAALVAATEAAVAHWRGVWSAVGVDLDVRYVESTIDPSLPYPAAMAGDFFLAASELVDEGEVPVVVGEIVDDNPTQYGAAGFLPGPIVRSPLSAIVVGWLANAGGDGVFSADDVLLYGEVLAHEVGHYAGLFHPVESAYDSWDALDDTPECPGEAMCEAMLGENLMFPYSICDGGTCVHATTITEDQRAVMHRYTGTR